MSKMKNTELNSRDKMQRKLEIQEIEDTIVNRILINFGIGIAGYVFLWMLWRVNLPTTTVFVSAAVFAVMAVVCFVLGKIKTKAWTPYGIMFCAFTVAMLIIKSSYVVSKFIGMEKFMTLMQSSAAVKLLNARNDVMFVAICGGVYLAVMLIVNIVMLIKSKR